MRNPSTPGSRIAEVVRAVGEVFGRSHPWFIFACLALGMLTACVLATCLVLVAANPELLHALRALLGMIKL